MKRILIAFFAFFILVGCTTSQTKEDLQFDEYETIQEKLIKQEEFEETDDFRLSFVYNQLENEYRYDLIIDNPKKIMYDITAMCYVDENSEDMFPNLGIFDKESYHLKKDYVNKEKGFYKGIQLSGTTKTKGRLKLYIHYYLDEEKKAEKELYIEVKNEIR